MINQKQTKYLVDFDKYIPKFCRTVVTDHGDFIYFSSARKGGEGGADLYRARISGPKPSAPRNLGIEINSSSDETNPAIRNAGFQLIFNSNRDDNPDALYAARSKRVVRLHDYSKMPSSEWFSSNIAWLIGFAAALAAFIWLFILAWRKPRQDEAQPVPTDDLKVDPAT